LCFKISNVEDTGGEIEWFCVAWESEVMDLDKEIMRFFLLGLNLLNGYRTEIVLLDHDE